MSSDDVLAIERARVDSCLAEISEISLKWIRLHNSTADEVQRAVAKEHIADLHEDKLLLARRAIALDLSPLTSERHH
jgi:ribosomal protein L19E